jgi:hypothetical protein
LGYTVFMLKPAGILIFDSQRKIILMEIELKTTYMSFVYCFMFIQTSVKCCGSGYLLLWRNTNEVKIILCKQGLCQNNIVKEASMVLYCFLLCCGLHNEEW